MRSYFKSREVAVLAPLLLHDIGNADTKLMWDAEGGELIRQRDHLNKELDKAKESTQEANRSEWPFRVNKTRLQEDLEFIAGREEEHIEGKFHVAKAEWEAENKELLMEMVLIHEESKHMLLRKIEALEKQLQAKMDKLKMLKEDDKKILKWLRLAKKKGGDLKAKLAVMLAGVLVKPETTTLQLL
ncbi:hypothetical protein R1flu_026214 [Riccia fluitans]|uniref:Uncharacterized protein n=1 Tax=Riccia fluitans TaxID=41844 RepID=A0ABD1XFB3_9MARC